MQKQSQHQNINMHSVELDDLLKLEVEAARDKLDDQFKPCADKLDAGASADKLEVKASAERDDEFKPSFFKLEVEASSERDDEFKPSFFKLEVEASADKLEVEASSERDDEFKPSLFRMCTSRVQVGASTDKLEVKASVERVEPVVPTSVESFESVHPSETAFKRHKRNDEDESIVTSASIDATIVVQCGIDFVCHENLNALSSAAPVVDNHGSMPYIA
jgi:hypothetical protein